MRRKYGHWAIAPLGLGILLGAVDIPLGQTKTAIAQTITQSEYQTQLQTLTTAAQTLEQQGQQPLAEAKYAEASQLVLTTAREILATIIPSIGVEHPALPYAQQALDLADKSNNAVLAAESLNLIGDIQFISGGTGNARRSHQQAIARLQGAGVNSVAAQAALANSTLHLGKIEQAVVNYSQANSLMREALGTFQTINDSEGMILAHQFLGDLARRQRQIPEASEQYRQALRLAQDTNQVSTQGEILLILGELRQGDRQYDQARQLFQEALATTQTSNQLQQRGKALNRLGSLALREGQYTLAAERYTEALTAAEQAGDLTEQGSILRNLSISYHEQGQDQEAFTYLQRSALVYNQMGLRALEAEALAEMAATQKLLGNPELAIIFYKQAVQVIETLREDLQILPEAERAIIPRVFAPVYRQLGDLLLATDRVAEAQQAVDLLKVQELDEYTRSVEIPEEFGEKGVTVLPAEQPILQQYNPLRDQAIALGKELLALRQIPAVERTAAQTTRITALSQQQQALTRDFSRFTQSAAVQEAMVDISTTAQEQNLNLNTLRRVADNLRNLEEQAIIFYPLVLENRLELIVASAYAPPIRHTVQVSKQELQDTIMALRQGLTTERRDTYMEPARQLYNWLIAPIEGDLQAAAVTTIIYAPDDQLRYVPLAALHDGDRWLIERFRVNNITAASLTDFTRHPSGELTILAGAFTDGQYEIQAGTRDYSFAGLPFAAAEVESIAQEIPGTMTLFDGDFSKGGTVPLMDSYRIVHFATHAAFVPGDPKDSFILFGNGDRLTMAEVQESWFLSNVELIVLSACQTAVGGELGNGEEILGFGYLMQDAGAQAAIASLWSVSDGGTQALMTHFYQQLQGGNMSKAEALRQAQLAMIRGELTVGGQAIANAAHPYYWSPFILIGNGL